MGAQQSTINPRYIRIWTNLSTMQSAKTRIEMLETLLQGPEYVQTAKQVGLYAPLLKWMAAVKRGEYCPWPATERIATQPQTLLAAIPPPKRALDMLNESYNILEIDDSKPLTYEALKAAYKRKAIQTHPDKGGSPEAFDQVTRAYMYIHEILNKLIPKTAQDGSDPRFTQPVTKEAAMLARGIKEVAPAQKGARRIEDQPPIALNPKKLDMNVFNKMFEENKLPDPEGDDGYGDWLKSNPELNPSTHPNLRQKFNKDVFHKTFEEETQKRAASQAVSKYKPPSELILNPSFGAELGSTRPDQYTKPPVSGGIGYTDLKHAYGDGSTFSQEIRDISLEGRPKTLEEAKREYGSNPRELTASESAAVQAFERAKEAAEEQRRRRMAANDVNAETFHARMQKRLNIQ